MSGIFGNGCCLGFPGKYMFWAKSVSFLLQVNLFLSKSFPSQWWQTWGCAHIHHSQVSTFHHSETSLALLYVLQTNLKVKQRVRTYWHHTFPLINMNGFCYIQIKEAVEFPFHCRDTSDDLVFRAFSNNIIRKKCLITRTHQVCNLSCLMCIPDLFKLVINLSQYLYRPFTSTV